jgi:tripartite-type tricarboxylate transporter receptor subunit TctC
MFLHSMNRRWALGTLGAAVLASQTRIAAAEVWKAQRPIRLIVPYPAGGSTDIVARVLSQAIGDRLGQPIVVDNKSGAAGAIGSQIAYTAAPDGLTLIIGATDSHCIYPHVYTKPIFKAEEFVAVGPIGVIPFVLMARPDLEATTAPDVVKLAKQRQLTYASWGAGSASHLATVLFMRATGLPPESMLHVPFTGSAPAAQAVSAGQVDLIFAPVPLVAGQKGRMKAIALIHPHRVEALPEVPTLAEQGVKVKMDGEFWMGVLAPPKTPANIVETTAAVFADAVALPEVKTRLAGLGIVPGTATPKEYAAFYQGEFARWGKVIKEAGIKLD